jgi:uncharacterized repeat protein (TIGR01451 family)
MDNRRLGFQILTAFVFLFTAVCLGINSSYSIDESNATNWDVSISNIEVITNSVSSYDIPKISGKSTSFNDGKFEIDSNGESITYKITVLNKGTVDAKIGAPVTITEPLCSNKTCEGLEYTLTYEDGSEVKRNDVLKSNEGKTLLLTYKFNGLVEEPFKVEDINLSINYVER